ncbi:hypothetical protein [Christiangramia aquimixticola]|uniref:LVIVD repeat-containing protein n=1 Tax=Christiangramia aquimixticola TaxID=1697558 RepID=UPI003AA8C134
MKKLLFLPVLLLLVFTSCEQEEDTGPYSIVAIPVTQTVEKFRSSVKIMEPRFIKESGKIYAWENYVFINDKSEGIHIIDNTYSKNPVKIKFLSIPGNTDIAIRNNKLYANQGMDLVVFDISDIENITEINRIEDVFPDYYYITPAGVHYVDFKNFDPQTQVIVGYYTEKRKIDHTTSDPRLLDAVSTAEGNRGTGGSMAAFSIVGDHLYVIDEAFLNAFDISSPDNPSKTSEAYVGWRTETIFNYEDHLYIGSATGMYIYDLVDPSQPAKVSFLQHVLGCDPVVVKGNYAYVTIRGGNTCEQNFNQLDIVDISDKSNPQIANSYEMTNPYGLGIKDDWLFVCDGSAGLKVFDIKDTPGLNLIDQFTHINTYDVIPLEDKLLMVGDNTLSQYSYKGNEISLISSFSLN